MSVKNLLTETVTVQSLATSANAFKGVTKTFTARAGLSNVKAGFRPIRGGLDDERTEFLKNTQRDFYRMYMDYNSASSNIAVTDRIIWDSKTLEIRGDAYNAGGRDVLLHVDCEMIR
jgi:hypothetical protein